MLKIFQIDAFTDKVFAGNPAAVVPLEHWPGDSVLQSIAAENNLAETAYLVPVAEGLELCWFTPATEIALCGHATLAAAYALVNHMGYKKNIINFYTRESGTLVVRQD